MGLQGRKNGKGVWGVGWGIRGRARGRARRTTKRREGSTQGFGCIPEEGCSIYRRSAQKSTRRGLRTCPAADSNALPGATWKLPATLFTSRNPNRLQPS